MEHQAGGGDRHRDEGSQNDSSGGDDSYLATHTVGLLILDMIMPGIDGAETYRRVLEIRPAQRAIIVSGFSETERVQEAGALGVGRYLRKPLTVAKLARAVREELDREG